MRTALDAPIDALDQGERSFVAKVREHGWVRTNILGDAEGPGFAFTTGFWANTGQPELIIFSTKSDIARDVLWHLFRSAKAGLSLPSGTITDAVFANLPAYAFPVAKRHYADYLGWSRWFYGGNEFPCLQIVWPDRESAFPWENSFDREFEGDQPDLTEHGWLAALSN
jgi:hypothetical protein